MKTLIKLLKVLTDTQTEAIKKNDKQAATQAGVQKSEIRFVMLKQEKNNAKENEKRN